MIKILFNGFRHGHINSLYKRVSESDFAAVSGCIEPDEGARKKAEETLGAEFSAKSYDEWLASDIDAVAVGNAYGDRGQVVIKALEAGKHVIADKPICTKLSELERIEELSREKGLAVVCMLDLRYIPQAIKAKEILDKGMLGEVRNIAFNGQHCIDYAHRPTWYFEKGMHGGTVNDLAIHGIDLVRMLTGLEFAGVDGARVWNSYAVHNKDFKDSAVFMARLENGAEVLADVSYSAPSQVFSMPTYWEFRFWCEKGLMTFNYADRKVTLFVEGAPVETVNCESIVYDYLDQLAHEIKEGRDENESLFKSTRTALVIQQFADNLFL